MKIKWSVSRIGYDEGCTGHVFENNDFRFEAIRNRFARSLVLGVYDAQSDQKLSETPFKSMESLEKHINENYLKIGEESP